MKSRVNWVWGALGLLLSSRNVELGSSLLSCRHFHLLAVGINCVSLGIFTPSTSVFFTWHWGHLVRDVRRWRGDL